MRLYLVALLPLLSAQPRLQNVRQQTRAVNNPQGPCSLAASLQLAASIPNFLVQERGDNEYTDLLAKPLPPMANGYRPLLTEPGLGITIDENKLKAQVGEPRPYRPSYDKDDGSIVDW